MSGHASWAACSVEQRTAGIAAALLIVSTLGPFSFVEATLILVAGCVLWLLALRGAGRGFELPFADGTLLAAAGTWSAILIATRAFERPLGQNLLALSCAGLLLLAGLRARAEVAPPAPAPAREPSPPPPTPAPPSPAAERTSAPPSPPLAPSGSLSVVGPLAPGRGFEGQAGPTLDLLRTHARDGAEVAADAYRERAGVEPGTNASGRSGDAAGDEHGQVGHNGA